MASSADENGSSTIAGEDFWDMEDPEEEDGMIVVPPQQRFLESVLATLPTRHQHPTPTPLWVATHTQASNLRLLVNGRSSLTDCL